MPILLLNEMKINSDFDEIEETLHSPHLQLDNVQDCVTKANAVVPKGTGCAARVVKSSN
jgi:hypothetical protein